MSFVVVASKILKESDDFTDYVPASQHRDRGFEHHTGHDHHSSYDTSTGGFQEAVWRVIKLSCENLLNNRAKINKFKLKILTSSLKKDQTIKSKMLQVRLTCPCS